MREGSFKKRNPEQTVIDIPQPTIPRELPALRTFVVRGFGGDAAAERTVEAHGVAFDDAGMVSFVVFFWVDAAKTQPAQAQKLVMSAGAWLEVEEVNPLFPSIEKH